MTGRGWDDLVRPVLERVVAAVRADIDRTPRTLAPESVPEPLRAILRLQRLRGPALDAVLRALDADDLRSWAAGALAPLDAVATLLLERPPGWRGVLEQAAAGAPVAGVPPTPAAERASRREERRLEAAHVARDRAVADAAAARDERDRTAALLRAAGAELEASAAARAGLAAELAATRAELDRVRSVAQQAATPPERPEPVEAAPVVDVGAARDALAAAEVASAALAEQLLRLSDLVAPASATVSASPTRRARRPPTTPSPVPPPKGTREDSSEAVRALLGLPGVVVLVDGYNVTRRVWGNLTPAEQRAQLERSATSLAVRTGVDIRLVFDGAEVGAVAAPPRRAVRVVFSEEGQEADDLLIDLCVRLRPTGPVAVVSDDRRVAEGVRRAGGNPVPVERFRALW